MRQIIEAIDRAVNPRLAAGYTVKPKVTAEWEKLLETTPIPSHVQIKAVGHECGFDVPDEVRAQLDALQATWDRDMALMLEFTPRKAREAYRAHGKALADKITAGADAHEHEGWTLEDFFEDYRGKVSAYKEAVKAHGKAAHDLIQPHLGKFIQYATEYVEQREENEQSLCEVFHLPYVPSRVQLLVRKTIQVVQARTKFENLGNSPRSIADVIM